MLDIEFTMLAQLAALALLLPTGLILLAGAGLSGRRPARSAMAGLGGVALATVSFWACGFALQMGGVGLVRNTPGLSGLVWEWASPLNLDWGVLGLRGFFMSGTASTPAAFLLFLSFLPPLTVSALLPMLSLNERMPGWMSALGGAVVAALVFPMVGNWFAGGGWLIHTGRTLGLSHGYVDMTGLSSAAFVGGLAAFLGILFFGRRLPPLAEGETSALPSVHLPGMAVLGVVLMLIGAVALSWSNPIQMGYDQAAPRTELNLILAAASGALLPSLYTWLTTGTADSLMAARGAAGGVLGVAAGAAFMPPWAALALGAIAGVLVPLLTYLVHHVLRVEDPTGALPIGLLGGALGILAPGILSDGLAGQGWNGVGESSYLGIPGQGVTGLFPAAGRALDWPGQVNAQLVGLAAIAVLTAVLVGVLFLVLKVLLWLWRAVPRPEAAD